MANLYRNQRERAEVEIGVIFPYANKRIITPILETVGHSPRFIGSLVSSFATIIADTTKVSLFILVQTFYNYKSTPRYATEYSFIIVSLCFKFSLTHFAQLDHLYKYG